MASTRKIQPIKLLIPSFAKYLRKTIQSKSHYIAISVTHTLQGWNLFVGIERPLNVGTDWVFLDNWIGDFSFLGHFIHSCFRYWPHTARDDGSFSIIPIISKRQEKLNVTFGISSPELRRDIRAWKIQPYDRSFSHSKVLATHAISP